MSAGNTPDDNQMTLPQQASGAGCLKAMGVVTLVMLAAMLLLGAFAWNSVGGFFGGIRQGLEDAVDSIEQFPQTVAEAVQEAIKTEKRASHDTKVELADSMKSMGMLVTASHSGDAVVHGSIRNGFINLCGVSVDHYAEGNVEAGVDLSQVSASDIVYDSNENSWTLTLGRARIHSCRIDYIQQHNHSFTLCRQDWDDYRILAESEAMKDILAEVLAEDLLNNAQIVAKQVLGNFLSAVTGSDNISVVFESEPVAEHPESCTRETPPNWVFDEESDSWVRE